MIIIKYLVVLKKTMDIYFYKINQTNQQIQLQFFDHRFFK